MAGEQRRGSKANGHGYSPLREMPVNLDMEQVVLGTILSSNDAFSRCVDLLTEECFHEQLHKMIFDAIASLIPLGRTANPITLRGVFGDQDLGGMTAAEYLARLAAMAEPPLRIREYATLLLDYAMRRRLISIAEDMLDVAYEAPVDATAKSMVDTAVEKLGALRVDPLEQSDFEDFDGASMRAILAAQEAYQRNGALVGVSTGLNRLDDALGGLQPTDLVILAGRPGMGKTALATNIAFSVARDLKRRRQAGEKTGVVAFSSLEMSSEQLSQRIISEQSGVPNWKVRRGLATEDEMMTYIETERMLRGLPLKIDPSGDLTIGTLRMRARNLHKRFGIEILIVDYLQLLHGTQKGRDFNRVQEVTEITTGLKALAKELRIPVLALSQLSRRVEERPDRRPMLSDLRESGSIEQDADCVMFVYREEYYIKKEGVPPQGTEAHLNWERRMRAAKGVAEVILAKNRHGPEGNVTLGFDSSVTKFVNEPEERESEPEKPAREKKKDAGIPKEASILFGVLRSLTMQEGVPTTPELMAADRNLRKKARLVPFERARELFGKESLGPEVSEDEADKAIKMAMKHLRAKELAFYTGNRQLGGFIWLPQMVE